MVKKIFKISGMHCNSCSDKIENFLKVSARNPFALANG